MKFRLLLSVISLMFFFWSTAAFSAYHHEGESDAGKFLAVYPDTAGTKLDNCALCHTGGSYVNSKGKTVELGSCQWCHDVYGYDGAGNIADTMNVYGIAYKASGRNSTAVRAIDGLDSDGDGYVNSAEITAGTYPGNSNDHPGLTVAPYRIYTRAQLEAMSDHTQFLLMNTSRSGDFYAEYTGVPMKGLLDDAGILSTATGIKVYAPDGWGQSHPLEYDASLDMYHVYGNVPGASYQYPPAAYYYDTEADIALNPDYGWCDYSAPSCAGRVSGAQIYVENGLKAILAYKREGAYLDTGVLSDENKLDGEGPFRVVVPQKYVGPPDQSSNSDIQDVIWPYDYDLDHSAGSCSRSATIIRVEPLPEGTTDIDVLEAGWNYVDQGKIIVYGAIDGTDSNGNGILDSEEKTDPAGDFDEDGTPDYQDQDTAVMWHANGRERVRLHTSAGAFSEVKTLKDDDPAVSGSGKPAMSIPYGVNKFKITGLTPGASVTVTLEFPAAVPAGAKYYKIDSSGNWREFPFTRTNNEKAIAITLTDGDSESDADGLANGIIDDPGALAVDTSVSADSDDDSDSGCFISSIDVF
ncbi:MAG: GEGP motif-containing diheme protein [Desulfobacterales bacterium]